MVDREQQQARRIADAISSDVKVGRDIAWIVAAGLTVTGLAWVAGMGERLEARTQDLAQSSLIALVAVTALVATAATVFAVRRRMATGRALDSLRELSLTDRLTGLPNRRFLGRPFEDMLLHARRSNGRVAVLFIDLDGIDLVNDTYGHDLGDSVMVTVADRLREAVSEENTVVRYGGDQFIAILTTITTGPSAQRVAKQLLESIERPIPLGDAAIHVSGCIGIALTEERPSRPEEVLSDADAAMQRARAEGPGHFAIFDRSMRDSITPATAERQLRQALENGEFRLYYQPIVSLWTKRMIGIEALLRWIDPVRGAVSPEEFIAALETTGLIVPVGNWVLHEVCRQTYEWNTLFPDHPALTVKTTVANRQVSQATFISQVLSALRTTGVAPSQIYLEFTESPSGHDSDSFWATLRTAKDLGVSLAINDFGTGHSSLSRLRQFDIALLSIDKSFVEGIDRSREDATIVKHVIGMAKAMGMVTVAEGVETEEQVTQLREMGCDLAQGWYFSHPQPPDVITQLLASSGEREEWHPPSQPAAGTAAPSVDIDRFKPSHSNHP